MTNSQHYTLVCYKHGDTKLTQTLHQPGLHTLTSRSVAMDSAALAITPSVWKANTQSSRVQTQGYKKDHTGYNEFSEEGTKTAA